MKLEGQQLEALRQIHEWYQVGESKTFRLGGYAGTGKTTMIYHLSRDIMSSAAVCAFTGKAASVLRSKGVEARTIHQTIYDAITKNGRVSFSLKAKLPNTRCLIVDEASMISQKLYDDLMSFGLKVLFVGDPAQLEPVITGNDIDMKLMVEPDYTMTEIYRQANDSNILKLADNLRRGVLPKKHGTFRDVELTGLGQVLETIKDPKYKYDMFLCGMNVTRHRANELRRTALGYSRTEQPRIGEPVVFLKNNYEAQVYNGLTGTIVSDPVHNKAKVGSIIWNYYQFNFKPDWNDKIIPVKSLKAWFGADGPDIRRIPNDFVVADFAYALTVHKAQGSEWDKVLVYEEVNQSWDIERWRYTAATRASTHLVYGSYKMFPSLMPDLRKISPQLYK